MEGEGDNVRVHDMQQYLMSPAGTQETMSSSTHAYSSSGTTNTSMEAAMLQGSPETRKALAWQQAVINRPLPELSLPSKLTFAAAAGFTHARTQRQSKNTIAKARAAPWSPSGSTESRQSSEWQDCTDTAADAAESSERRTSNALNNVKRTRKHYRLEMPNQVVAGLWKALTDLKPP